MSVEYLLEAEKLKRETPKLADLVVAMQQYLINHFETLGRSYKAHSILESRFTPPEIAFHIGMSSCGTKTNIVTDMLRHVGYEVKKVHGSVPQSADHAWISVKDSADNIWKQFDVTKKMCEVTAEHAVIKICNEWIDISDYIEKAFVNGNEE